MPTRDDIWRAFYSASMAAGTVVCLDIILDHIDPPTQASIFRDLEDIKGGVQ